MSVLVNQGNKSFLLYMRYLNVDKKITCIRNLVGIVKKTQVRLWWKIVLAITDQALNRTFTTISYWEHRIFFLYIQYF